MSTSIGVRSSAAASDFLHVAGSGDVKISRSLPLEQPTFTHLGVVCVQCFEPLSLFGISINRNPEVVILVVGDFDVQLGSDLWLMVELQFLVGEPNRMVMMKFLVAVAVPKKLRDALVEGVFS